jgi:hypothetical protein
MIGLMSPSFDFSFNDKNPITNQLALFVSLICCSLLVSKVLVLQNSNNCTQNIKFQKLLDL